MPGDAVSIVPLEIAKEQLVITDTDHDSQVQRAIDLAEADVREWMDPGTWDPTWTTPDQLPGVVYQAILFKLANFYENKGDNLADRDEKAEDAKRRLLWRKHSAGIA